MTIKSNNFAVTEYSSSMQIDRLNKLTRLYSLYRYRGCRNIARWYVTHKADRENNYGAPMDGSRVFENSSSRTVTSKERMLRTWTQTNYFGCAKVCANIVNVTRRPEKRQVVSFGNIKNRSHRVSTVVSWSTIFFHRCIATKFPGINSTLMSAGIQIEMADILYRHHRCSYRFVPKKRYSGLSETRDRRDSHIPAEARSARRNSY